MRTPLVRTDTAAADRIKGAFDQIDRAALNPRPRRRIPICFGGFAERSAGPALGEEFIFVDGMVADAARKAGLKL